MERIHTGPSQGGLETVDEEVNMFKCKACIADFETEKQLNNHYLRIKDKDHSHIIFNESNIHDWIECKIIGCSLRRKKISKHVEVVHQISKEEYEKIYGEVISKNYREQMQKNGQLASKTVDERVYRHKCKIENCENIIEGKALICVSCKLKDAKEKQELKLKQNNEKFINKIEGIDFIRCKCKLEDGSVCNWPDVRLTGHIRHHGYSYQRYKQEFNGAPLVCKNLNDKTRITGKKFTEEVKKQMSDSHLGIEPWNKGLTKEDHPSLAAIAEKAEIRLSQLDKNNWHTNPVSNKGKTSWTEGLTNQNSEILEEKNNRAKGIYHHQSSFNPNLVFNDFIYTFESSQKQKVKGIDEHCFNCGTIDDLTTHHFIPKRCFDFYDLDAHHSRNLITLCEKCHSSLGQTVDKATIATLGDNERFKKEFPKEFEIFSKWQDYATKRFVSILPIPKRIIQMLSIEQRTILSKFIFEDLRTSFQYLNYHNEILLQDFELVKKSQIKMQGDLIRNYVSSGTKIRDNFIRQQYKNFTDFIFNDDEKFMKLIRNRLGLDWNNNPEFFEMSNKTILRGFEVVFPSYRFSKYSIPIARWVIDNYCDGNRIYDYAAGWGCRMIAAASCDKQYICVDTNTELVKELEELAIWLQQNSKANIRVENANAAEFVSDEIDLAFSCPPYGMKEKYENMTFNSQKQWQQEYIIPMIKNCYKSLRIGGKFVCHISKKLEEIIKEELDKYFKHIRTISVINVYGHFNKIEKERINEVILVYQK